MINLNQQNYQHNSLACKLSCLSLCEKRLLHCFGYYSVYLESDWVDALKEYLISKYSVHPTLWTAMKRKREREQKRKRNQIII